MANKEETKSKLSLDDINNDPSILNSCTDEEALALNRLAYADPYYPLAGTLRYILSARANSIQPPDTED